MASTVQWPAWDPNPPAVIDEPAARVRVTWVAVSSVQVLVPAIVAPVPAAVKSAMAQAWPADMVVPAPAMVMTRLEVDA